MWDLCEEVHFDEAGKLARGNLQLEAEGAEGVEREEGLGGDSLYASAGAWGLCVNGDICGSELGFEDFPVAGVSELIEFLTRVFDCQLGYRGVGSDFIVYGLIQLRAVARFLIGRKKEEL